MRKLLFFALFTVFAHGFALNAQSTDPAGCVFEGSLFSDSSQVVVGLPFVLYVRDNDTLGCQLAVQYTTQTGNPLPAKPSIIIRLLDLYPDIIDQGGSALVPFLQNGINFSINRDWVEAVYESTGGRAMIVVRDGRTRFLTDEDFATIRARFIVCPPTGAGDTVLIDAENGLYVANDTIVRLGGFLIEDTRIETDTFDFEMQDVLTSTAFGIDHNSVYGDTVFYAARRWGTWRNLMTIGRGGFFHEIRDTVNGERSHIYQGLDAFNVPYLDMITRNGSSSKIAWFSQYKDNAFWLMKDTDTNPNYTASFFMGPANVGIGMSEIGGGGEPGNGVSVIAYGSGTSDEYIAITTKAVDNSTATVGQFLQLQNVLTGEVEFATIDLSPYLLIADTAAMLLNYPSTAGWGITDLGKTWRADTNRLATQFDISALPTGSGTTNYYAKWSSSTALSTGNLFDNGTYVGILNSKPFQFGQWTTAGRPTGVSGQFGWNTTLTGLDWYNGTRWATGLESTFARGTNKSFAVFDANGQVINSHVQLRGTNAAYSVYIGNLAGNTATGTYNTALGEEAVKITSGSANTGVGAYALYSNIGGSDNVAIGVNTLYSNTSGTKNIAIGRNSQLIGTTAFNNIAIGYEAQRNNTGNENTAIGNFALRLNTGNSNIGVGSYSLTVNSSGIDNFGIGNNSLFTNTIGSYNAAIGNNALYSNLSGNYNTGIGTRSLYTNSTAQYNVGIGTDALYSTTGSFNVGIGSNVGYRQTTGSNNVFIGYNSFYATVTPGAYSSNIGIGYEVARNVATGADNNIIIGNSISLPTAGGDNQIIIGNLFFGTGASGTGTSVAGKAAIKKAAPDYDFDITSTDAFGLPRGTVAQQPTIAASTTPFRYNTDSTALEYGESVGVWKQLATRAYARSLVSALPTTNIYTANGTATGNRTYSGANYSLDFNGISKLGINSNRFNFSGNSFYSKNVDTTGANYWGTSPYWGTSYPGQNGFWFRDSVPQTSEGQLYVVSGKYGKLRHVFGSDFYYNAASPNNTMYWKTKSDPTANRQIDYGIDGLTLVDTSGQTRVQYRDFAEMKGFFGRGDTTVRMQSFHFLRGDTATSDPVYNTYYQELSTIASADSWNSGVYLWNEPYMTTGFTSPPGESGGRSGIIKSAVGQSSTFWPLYFPFNAAPIDSLESENYVILGETVWADETKAKLIGYGTGAKEAGDFGYATPTHIAAFVPSGTGLATVVDLKFGTGLAISGGELVATGATVELKRDTTIYTTDADYDLSAALTTAQINTRYNRIIIFMTITSSGSVTDHNTLTMHTPDANLAQCEIVVYSIDDNSTYRNDITFGTNNLLSPTGSTNTTYNLSGGQWLHVRVADRSGYKYFISY